jgi:hypothetical protein
MKQLKLVPVTTGHEDSTTDYASRLLRAAFGADAAFGIATLLWANNPNVYGTEGQYEMILGEGEDDEIEKIQAVFDHPAYILLVEEL